MSARAETISPTALEELRQRLEAQRLVFLAEYEHDVEREREVPLDEPGDVVDIAERSWDREAMFAATESERSLLQQVEDALHRLDDGTYGSCLECGVEIPLARLRAIPWTPLCAVHQQDEEARAARRAFGAPHRRFPHLPEADEG